MKQRMTLKELQAEARTFRASVGFNAVDVAGAMRSLAAPGALLACKRREWGDERLAGLSEPARAFVKGMRKEAFRYQIPLFLERGFVGPDDWHEPQEAYEGRRIVFGHMVKPPFEWNAFEVALVAAMGREVARKRHVRIYPPTEPGTFILWET